MSDKPCVGDVLDDYLKALEAGNAPDRETLLARHPELADELAAAFLGLDFVRGAAPSLAGDGALEGKALGDYRLLREIGRGGMAVVYEAEQVSLGRRVALKVLPLAAVLDPKQLQRFKNEALAAAHLQHPHIVPVHGVGSERGVHYYAMQYIEGQSLAAAIRSMKGGGTGEGTRTPISSHGSNRETAYIRMAAALGVQAAEALDHAHQLGIVHRDVKPANLLVDPAGALWVTDFGLASSVADVSLTMTGELLGTIRYMSPEQALAKRAPVDHRTDVYSLGATLYELFTLEAAFPGDDPHVVIQNIAAREPVPPRKLNPTLSRDLETVLLKAMSKDPSSRYATAQEMADDLRRCLEGEAVQARRPGFITRGLRWGLRHRTIAASAAVVLLLAIVGLATGNSLLWREKERTQRALERADGNLSLALEALDEVYVSEPGGDSRIRESLPPDVLRRALKFYEAFAARNENDTDMLGALASAHYRASQILRRLGEDGEAALALDRAIGVFQAILRDAPGDWRAHCLLGEALIYKPDVEGAIRACQEDVRIRPEAAAAHFGLGNALKAKGDLERAIAAYDEAIRLSPEFAKAHCNRGIALAAKGQIDAAILSYNETIRLCPEIVEAHSNLAHALAARNDIEGALRACERAVQLRPDDAALRNDLGVLLTEKGDPEGAIRSLNEAIRIRPDLFEAHFNLGNALGATGDADGAARAFEEAIRLRADAPDAHYGLGVALQNKGEPERAIAAYEQVIRLRPDYQAAHYNLGIARMAVGDFEGALVSFGEAVRLRPDHAEAHCNLGLVLVRQGRYQEAVQSLRRGHELGSQRQGWPHPSKAWLDSAESKAEVARRLEEFLCGVLVPKDARERIAFADVLHARGRSLEAAGLYRDALTEDAAVAGDLAGSYRYDAACCAALAGAQGDPEAAAWRARSLDWLRADLATREKADTKLAATLAHWRQDPDLAGVRDRLAGLPEAEREAWAKLWADVDAALARASKQQ